MLFACLLCFTACQQDELLNDVAVVEPTELELASSYLAQERSLILFAALQVDHENNEVSGYIIDKFATIREVNLEQSKTVEDLGRDIISDKVLRELHEYSTEVGELSKIELANMARAAKGLSEQDRASENADNASSRLYLAFEFNAIPEECDCSSSSDGVLYSQLMIHAQGHLNGENSKPVAADILTWLQTIEEANDK